MFWRKASAGRKPYEDVPEGNKRQEPHATEDSRRSIADESQEAGEVEQKKPQKSGWFSWIKLGFGSVDWNAVVSAGQEAMADSQKKQGGDSQEPSKAKADAVQDVGQTSDPDKKDQKALQAAKDEDPQALDKMDLPGDKKQLMQALAAQQNATGLLAKANSLKDTAMKAMNKDERRRMLQEAYDKEIEAHGQSKFARRLQSGPWQGGVGGAGIGGGVGMGVGTVVGTLVGGVVSLPTTALGGLVGMGVGGIHGPFVKLDQSKAKAVAERAKTEGKSDEEIEEAVRKEAVVEEVDEEEAKALEGGVEGSGTPRAAISQPQSGEAKKNLERHHSGSGSKVGEQTGGDRSPSGSGGGGESGVAKKKPRKIEVRSGSKAGATTGDSKENAVKS
ncbi:hypothetical protein Tdes44962_MAKER03193 [Teratosphaeria destructans]|uniref:Uncharacterized protein n=1 Tax=Teratosphaeria destructans TaxID=418781 RepID=A0A9W7SR01_9PEZI|nr:hypothetical protein Tdes44962_MAKER03193 [Teratosphaeria destructans]